MTSLGMKEAKSNKLVRLNDEGKCPQSNFKSYSGEYAVKKTNYSVAPLEAFF